MPAPAYTYAAEILRVIDGDTITARVSLGWNVSIEIHGRLHGVNTREHDEPGGAEATEHLAELIPPGTKLTLQSLGPDKFGNRWQVRLTTDDGHDVAQRMIADGYAAPWNGRGERPTVPWPPAA